jgi:two-component system chemotaxis response regulator CheV
MASSSVLGSAKIGVDTGILLEAGTNEAEVLVFRVRGKRYGVNVAKVREVIPIEQVTDMPMAHPAVDGLVDIRAAVVPLVNLEKYLYGNTENPENAAKESLMLLEFNNWQIAFRVEGIERIFRVSWKDTLPAPQLGEAASPITSILRQEQGLVPLLDFESIVTTIGIGGGHSPIDSVAKVESKQRAHVPIVYADDSRLICEMIKDALCQAGFASAKGFADGKEAWDYMAPLTEESTPEEFAKRVACVITDVEMPRMDGLNFTKKIRQDPVMSETPVIVFSSIASKDNDNKRKQVGATAQVAKPNYDTLIDTIVEVLGLPTE